MAEESNEDFIEPPQPRTAEGAERRVGVEIEFTGLHARDAAALVQRRFGGDLRERDPHRFHVADTQMGDFMIELDSRYVHGPEATGDAGGSSDGERPAGGVGDVFERRFQAALGDLGRMWLPVEIVGPPVALGRLNELDRIIDDLRLAGAAGTDEGPLFAFATQFNPEVPSIEHHSILRHLKAFLLLSDWLRREIALDIKRRLLPFVDPFPPSYVRKVVDPEYRPSRERLIDDYLEANPTRDRELDMMPLFCHLDPERVRARIDDPRIKPRPTFHYRLPDTRLGDREWRLVTEWNRWVRVEQLADDTDALRRAGENLLRGSQAPTPRAWINAVESLFR